MQNSVRNFNEKNKKKDMTIGARFLDIQSELGELAKEYLKSTAYDTKKFVLTKDFKMEFGDVIYSMLSLANEVGLSSQECLDMVLKKYQLRIDKNNSFGSGR